MSIIASLLATDERDAAAKAAKNPPSPTDRRVAAPARVDASEIDFLPRAGREQRPRADLAPITPHGAGRPATLTITDHDCVWNFVYVYFSSGTPYDAPDRSEPCRSE